MRDPDLLLCAQRAAARLEDAWDRWRTLRGPDGGSAGEVSSYVGYSQNEPRGRPRVVVGVDAEEAERLAALIDSGCALGAPAGGADSGSAGGAGGSADGGASGNGAATSNGAYQDANGVPQEAARVAEPEACEICGQRHAEDDSSEPGEPAPSPEAVSGPQPVPAQPDSGQQPVPAQQPDPGPQAVPAQQSVPRPRVVPAQQPASSQLPTPSQLPVLFTPQAAQAPAAPVQAVPRQAAPAQAGAAPPTTAEPRTRPFPAQPMGTQPFPAQPAGTRPIPAQPAAVYPAAAYPAAAYPIPGMAAAGPAGQGEGPARDSAETGEAGPAASGADAGEPEGAPEPPAGKIQARKNAQAEADDEDADEWSTAAAVPAELSGWASAAPPSQAYAGLAAWVAACSEPGDQDSGSLPRSA